MHILAQNSSGAQQSMLLRIYEAFKKRGVNCTEVDEFGNNPLHYAVEQRCEPLVFILLEVMSLD